MKHQEAKRLIVREWDRWIQTQPIDAGCASARDSLKFFVELQDTRPTLLDFLTRGRDKWRVVHGWLLSERRVERISKGVGTSLASANECAIGGLESHDAAGLHHRALAMPPKAGRSFLEGSTVSAISGAFLFQDPEAVLPALPRSRR